MTSSIRYALFPVLVLCLLAAPSVAKDEKKNGDPVKETVKQINAALTKGDLATAKSAFDRAFQLKDTLKPNKFTPVLRAIGKAVAHKRPEIAMAAVETLGKLRVPGSSKMLGKLLAPPAKKALDKIAIYRAALAAAGSIRDPSSVKVLEKLLGHIHPEIAVAAAEAFAGYKALDPKPKLTLIGKLIPMLAKLEKKASTTKKEEEQATAERVKDALGSSIKAIAGHDGANTSKEWTAWLKEARKQAKKDA